jgi:drug/metabolite transporter (DMT)-like permease
MDSKWFGVSRFFSAATLWNALNARLWFGARVAPRVMVAGVIGLGGLILLFWPELASHGASRNTLLGLGFALLGTFCFSTGNMLSSLQQRAGIKPLTGNAYSMFMAPAFYCWGVWSLACRLRLTRRPPMSVHCCIWRYRDRSLALRPT